MPKIYVSIWSKEVPRGESRRPTKIMSTDVDVIADLDDPGDPDPDEPLVRLEGKDITISLTADSARDLIEGLNRAIQKIEDADNPYK